MPIWVTSFFERANAVLDLPVETDAGLVMRAFVRARLALWEGRPRAVDACPGEGIVSKVVALLVRVHATRALADPDRAFLESLVGGASTRVGLLTLQVLAELDLAIDARSPERALAHVRRAVASGLLDVAWMSACPLLAPLRDAPDWAALHGEVAARAARVRAAARDGEG